MKVTIIIGLPGSGKTHLAREMYPDAYIIDDPISVKDLLVGKPHIVVTHPDFCSPNRLKSFKLFINHHYDDVEFEEIYFENDPDQCRINALGRGNKKVGGLISLLTKEYKPPIIAIPVWNNK